MTAAPRILILDHDPRMGDELSELFSDRGFEVDTAGTLAQAVEKMRVINFDGIIVDVNLPQMDCHELLSVIESLTPGIKIIATARENSLELESKVRRHQIVYYYLKYFDLRELELVMENLFGKRLPPPRRH